MTEFTEEQKIADERRRQALIWLRTNFPKTFPDSHIPLKIGIHQDIFALSLTDAPSKRLVRQALGFYVNSFGYLRSLAIGAPRIDLNGEQVGEVTEQEAQAALAKIIEKYREKVRFTWQEKKKWQHQEAKKRRTERKAAAKLKEVKVAEKILLELATEISITEEILKSAKFGKVLTLKKKTTITEAAT